MKVLVTGGAGYIGSTVANYLLTQKAEVVIVDSLVSSSKANIPSKAKFYPADLLDSKALEKVFSNEKPDSVLHFAGFIQVGESVANPLKYYHNNIIGSINLLNAMKKFDCDKIVFSSTAAVYGNPLQTPITEDDPLKPVNPYGHSKLIVEQMLSDCQKTGILNFVCLRYFNACGASFGTGENHVPETHLIPLVLQSLQNPKKPLFVFGNDYDTPDGTCVRDYVHVEDLARAHWLALQFLVNEKKSDYFNLGSGEGNSVLEIISAAEKATGKKISFEYKDKRPGDPPRLVASNQKARSVLGWKPEKTLDEILASAWQWEQSKKTHFSDKGFELKESFVKKMKKREKIKGIAINSFAKRYGP
ncbi:MAG: UDP-glucose 4-epimerase GalE [Candidatus Micrarchaeota archaeon]